LEPFLYCRKFAQGWWSLIVFRRWNYITIFIFTIKKIGIVMQFTSTSLEDGSVRRKEKGPHILSQVSFWFHHFHLYHGMARAQYKTGCVCLSIIRNRVLQYNFSCFFFGTFHRASWTRWELQRWFLRYSEKLSHWKSPAWVYPIWINLQLNRERVRLFVLDATDVETPRESPR